MKPLIAVLMALALAGCAAQQAGAPAAGGDKVTISIGFASIKLGDTPSQILDSADEALYWAKENGRNQCHAYETLVAEGKLQRPMPEVSEIEFF